MSRERIGAIVTKEWLDLRRNRAVISAMIGMPLVLTIMSSTMMTLTARAVTRAEKAPPTKGMPEHLAQLTSDPRIATLMMTAFSALMLFSITPVVLPSIMAAHSVVGEKQSRSLEPLLATPIRTWELIVGKLLAILFPVLIPSVVGYLAYAIVVLRVAPHPVFLLIVSPRFLLTVGLVGPLAAVLSITFGIMVSSRAADLQTAQGISGLLVLPVIALGTAQLFGAVSLSVTAVLVQALVLLVIDVAMLLLCVSVFERETILARLK